MKLTSFKQYARFVYQSAAPVRWTSAFKLFHVISSEDSPVEVEEQEEEDAPVQMTAGKIGAKKQRKLEEKQARKAQREVREPSVKRLIIPEHHLTSA